VAIESSSKKRAEKIDFVAAELAGEVKTDSEGSTPAKTRGNSRTVFMVVLGTAAGKRMSNYLLRKEKRSTRPGLKRKNRMKRTAKNCHY